MSTTIYNPYFYIIQHISSGKYYAGVKYSKNSNPDNLLKFDGYHTSSEIVKQIILEEGLESFIIRKIKVFENASQALVYELRFLKRVNAAFNDNFLNRSNNSMNALNADYEKRKQTCLENFGCEHPMQSPEIREKHKQTCLENFGYENPNQSPEVREKSKQTNLEKYGVENPFQLEAIKEKIKKTNLEKYGCEYITQVPEAKEKKKQTCLENHGVENPMQSLEIKERMKQNSLEKFGYDHPSRSLDVQIKQSNSRIALMNRPTVLLIKKYKEKFNLKLIVNWFCKKQEFLDVILEELKTTYGELEYL